MPRLALCMRYLFRDRRACVPWQGVCAGARGGACGRSASHRAYRQPCGCCPRTSCLAWCSICTTESPRVVSDTLHLFWHSCCRGRVHPLSRSGVSFAGFSPLSSAPSAALAFAQGLWYTLRHHPLASGSGSITRCCGPLHPLPFYLSMTHRFEVLPDRLGSTS